MDYSKMSDVDMSREVAKALKLPWSWNGGKTIFVADDTDIGRHSFDPCNNPTDAYPIIYKNGISTGIYGYGEWGAATINHKYIDGVNPLRAAMIVFLMMQESANVQDNPA